MLLRLSALWEVVELILTREEMIKELGLSDLVSLQSVHGKRMYR